ncbi:HeH/LEM domain-containing protein [Pandoraea sp. PE-S2R-1]|uniref:HeH/LEM domain-containing protein n=1 Tax=Pandoraea sp. PE-S2R-1 TaxID=1986994 RepID=UPI000B3FDE84|nr:HeH/LEM domain-containing protein [Pandoraea sp. PE-S2R-1]
MAKLIAAFLGVLDGDIYPTQFEAGDECPPELEAGAQELGALGDESVSTEDMTAAQIKAALDANGVEYKASMSKAELLELLTGAGE